MSSGPQFNMDDYTDPFEDDGRGHTYAVLMDVGEERKKTDETIGVLRNIGIASAANEVPFGLKPHLSGLALQSLRAMMADPSWANALYAAALAAVTSDDEHLRECLIQTASIAVQWAEIIDRQKEDA